MSIIVSRVLFFRQSSIQVRRLDRTQATSSGWTGSPTTPSTVLLRTGFTQPASRHAAGKLLPHLSTLALTSYPNEYSKRQSGRYISVALSLKSPSPGITRRPALWSPDFPHTGPFGFRTRLSIILKKSRKTIIHHLLNYVTLILFNGCISKPYLKTFISGYFPFIHFSSKFTKNLSVP